MRKTNFSDFLTCHEKASFSRKAVNVNEEIE